MYAYFAGVARCRGVLVYTQYAQLLLGMVGEGVITMSNLSVGRGFESVGRNVGTIVLLGCYLGLYRREVGLEKKKDKKEKGGAGKEKKGE
jgi:hypothetical protein